jgi:hypothetical protein
MTSIDRAIVRTYKVLELNKYWETLQYPNHWIHYTFTGYNNKIWPNTTCGHINCNRVYLNTRSGCVWCLCGADLKSTWKQPVKDDDF